MTLPPFLVGMMGSAQSRALGLVLDSAGDGRVAMTAPWREDLVGDPETQVIASGVVTTLLDHCCGAAVMSRFTELASTATLDLRIDYMRPAAPRMGVVAEANCYKMTRTVAFVRAECWDEDRDDLVATAQAVFVINRTPGP